KALADAIIEILTDKEKAKRLAKEGMKRARDFEVGRIAKEFEKTFIELTSQ
ncbi:MAG: glycosyl transferase, partial [Euryarchaeota archaeon HGW-Euryarchaeota-1]